MIHPSANPSLISLKADFFKIAFLNCMLPLVVVVFQAACFAGDTSQAPPAAKTQGEQPVYDIVVYGDSSGAVIAAIAAKREGRSVVLVNPTSFPGGMSSSGLGATDFLGKRNTFGGIVSEFYDRIAGAYGTNYIRSFEPHIGKQVFEKMIADAGVKVVYNEKLDRAPGKGVKMKGKRIGCETYFGLRGSTDIPPYVFIRGDRAVTPPTDHIEALPPEIMAATRKNAPSGEMFRCDIRWAGLDLLARFRIREGMALCVDIMNQFEWGRDPNPAGPPC